VERYIYKTSLKNGTSVVFRLIKLLDKEWLRTGYSALSFRSQFYRFISPPRQLSEKDLKYLTEVDNKNHVAVVAFALKDSHKSAVGVARYVKLADCPDSAEFAITVADAYQGMGVGTVFFRLLAEHALGNSVRNLIGYVLGENLAMLKILEHYNLSMVREEGSTLKITIPLDKQAR